MANKEYRRTKGLFFVYDPAAEDYFKGMYRGAAEYTKFQWDAQEYKTLQGALTVADRLGRGFVVVDKDGKTYSE